eukprot:3269712-Amphidinium_carterae.1
MAIQKWWHEDIVQIRFLGAKALCPDLFQQRDKQQQQQSVVRQNDFEIRQAVKWARSEYGFHQFALVSSGVAAASAIHFASQSAQSS